MKNCRWCKIEQPIERYAKDKWKKDGLSDICKACFALYRFLNRDKLRQQHKIYNKNRDTPEYREKRAIYRKNNKHIYQAYVVANKEKIKNKKKEYLQNNPEAKRKIIIRVRDKRRSNPLINLRCTLRSRIYDAIKKGEFKKKSTIRYILGADIKTIKCYIERQFKKGMTWENHGHYGNKWHIDHKIPLGSAKTEEELIILCHYTNLQPLWAIDNIKKSDKIIPTQMIMPI